MWNLIPNCHFKICVECDSVWNLNFNKFRNKFQVFGIGMDDRTLIDKIHNYCSYTFLVRTRIHISKLSSTPVCYNINYLTLRMRFIWVLKCCFMLWFRTIHNVNVDTNIRRCSMKREMCYSYIIIRFLDDQEVSEIKTDITLVCVHFWCHVRATTFLVDVARLKIDLLSEWRFFD